MLASTPEVAAVRDSGMNAEAYWASQPKAKRSERLRRSHTRARGGRYRIIVRRLGGSTANGARVHGPDEVVVSVKKNPYLPPDEL